MLFVFLTGRIKDELDKTQAYKELDEAVNSKGLTLGIVEPVNLNDLEISLLIDELYDVAVDAFGRDLLYEAITGRTQESTMILTIRDLQQRLLGYMVNDSLDLVGKSVNYYNTDMIRRELQGNGLYKLLNKVRIEALPSDIILTRTQNPVVYRSFSKMCKQNNYSIYPNGTRPTNDLLEIIKAYDSSAQGMIAREVYFGRSLMYDTPLPQTEVEKEIWQNIRVDKGDGVYILGVKN